VADINLGTLQQLAETGSKIRFAPGVIGKGAMMWLGVVAVWVAVIIKLSPADPLFDALLLAAGMFVSLLVTRETQKMRNYAEKNPSTALLEGAELLAFKRIEASAKELPAGDVSPPTTPSGDALIAQAKPENPQT